MKTRNENLILSKEDAHNLPVGSKFYKAICLDEFAIERICTIGRFKTIEDLNEYCQQWCYDEIDDYEQAILIITYEIMDSGKALSINKEIVWLDVLRRMINMEIIIKEGYSFIYSTSDCYVGSIANIDKPEGLKINVDQIKDQYYVSFKLDGVFIQIWCVEYKIKKIGGQYE